MKSIFKSKTFYFNVLTIVVFVATTYFGYQPNDVLTHNLMSIVTNPFFIGGVNLVLRYFTKKAVAFSVPTSAVTIDSLPDATNTPFGSTKSKS